MDVAKVKNVSSGGRYLEFYCVVNNDGIPLLEPGLYLLDLAKAGNAISTTENYARVLKDFFGVLDSSGGDLKYDQVTDAQMTGYLNGYRVQKLKNSPETVNYHATILNEFYKKMANLGISDNLKNISFTWEGLKKVKNKKEVLSTEILQIYMDKKSFEEDVLANITATSAFKRERDEIALKLGYYAGFRTHELVSYDNLNVKELRKLLPKQKDWTPKSMKLKIMGKGNKMRSAQVSVELAEAIYNFIWNRGSHLTGSLMAAKSGKDLVDKKFGTKLFERCVKARILKGVENIDDWLARRYHTLRKCYATNSVTYCYKKGKDPMVFVSQWMGHTDYEMTKIYVFYYAVVMGRVDILNTLSLKDSRYERYNKKKKDED
ncbi:site-specific integrase [Colwellia demingiae]|uniref:Site-specific integrase n=1 Tax=Colwellia demingiae TaxID=89401 RepID=A0A5C6QDM7_9GAMM|nr:site-specific integrase [Colwellia demingiae]TWX67155.1 site-specific integrase [Colwellia demingiae]